MQHSKFHFAASYFPGCQSRLLYRRRAMSLSPVETIAPIGAIARGPAASVEVGIDGLIAEISPEFPCSIPNRISGGPGVLGTARIAPDFEPVGLGRVFGSLPARSRRLSRRKGGY
jgi:hypothetical protein